MHNPRPPPDGNGDISKYVFKVKEEDELELTEAMNVKPAEESSY